MKKANMALLGSILFASQAQAAFDQGAAILYAYDTSGNDTYFVDIGVTGQDLLDLVPVSITDSGLAAFLASNTDAKWTLIASVNDTTFVAGPPAFGQSLLNSGVISTSTSGSNVGATTSDNDVQRFIMNDWIEDVQASSGGLSSFGVAGTDSVSADAPRNSGFFNDSLIDLNQHSDVYYSQANPEAGASFADPSVVRNLNPGIIAAFSETCGMQGSASLSSAGDFNYSWVTLASCEPMEPPVETPVPASLWLFASALFASAGFRYRRNRR